MILMPPWYHWLNDRLQPSRPLMYALGLLFIGITLWLMWRGSNVSLALWLTYLAMP